MYVFGGKNNEGSIETIFVGVDMPWTIICESSQVVNRFSAAITVVSPQKIALFGGFKDGIRAKDGYVFDIGQSSVKSILGSSSDIGFISSTPVKQITTEKHVSVVSTADYNIDLVQLEVTVNAFNFKTRSI